MIHLIVRDTFIRHSVKMFLNLIIILMVISLTMGYYIVQESELASESRSNARIVNGSQIDIEQCPYQVSIRYYVSHRCGGAIINENTILTAAHCFNAYNFDNSFRDIFTVRVGTRFRAIGGKIYNIQNIIKHEKFNSTNFYYDLAIVKLAENLLFSNTVQSVALPHACFQLPIGELGTISGWGRLEFDGEIPTELFAAQVQIMDSITCTRLYTDINVIPDHMFCAGYPNGHIDSCNGDSGGPIVWNNILIGIISWGIECALPNYPGVYISVNKLLNWIEHYI